jgi:hypothetical protein
MNSTKNDTKAVAITTYGMNNHSVRTDQYRYIRYEDGSEELYNHAIDPNEWTNEAGNKAYKKVKARLLPLLPHTNANWNTHSAYTYQPYFVNQKERNGKIK